MTSICMRCPVSNDIVKVFTSINEASRIMGVNRKHLKKAVHDGDSLSPTKLKCAGYLWESLTDYRVKTPYS